MTLPPRLNDRDTERSREILAQLSALKREYEMMAAPLTKELSRIYAAYQPVLIMLPDDEAKL
jgi:hypothetical protein